MDPGQRRAYSSAGGVQVASRAPLPRAGQHAAIPKVIHSDAPSQRRSLEFRAEPRVVIGVRHVVLRGSFAAVRQLSARAGSPPRRCPGTCASAAAASTAFAMRGQGRRQILYEARLRGGMFTGTSLAGAPVLRRALRLHWKWKKTARCVNYLV